MALVVDESRWDINWTQYLDPGDCYTLNHVLYMKLLALTFRPVTILHCVAHQLKHKSGEGAGRLRSFSAIRELRYGGKRSWEQDGHMAKTNVFVPSQDSSGDIPSLHLTWIQHSRVSVSTGLTKILRIVQLPIRYMR